MVEKQHWTSFLLQLWAPFLKCTWLYMKWFDREIHFHQWIFYIYSFWVQDQSQSIQKLWVRIAGRKGASKYASKCPASPQHESVHHSGPLIRFAHQLQLTREGQVNLQLSLTVIIQFFSVISLYLLDRTHTQSKAENVLMLTEWWFSQKKKKIFFNFINGENSAV